MAFLTAWIPLTELVRIAFGARVLITAAAGAVGTAAVQIVSTLNGAPVAAVGSAAKLELPRSLGAVEAVTYEQIGELEPVDVVFDLVGGEVFADVARPPEADGHRDRSRLRGRDVGGRRSRLARRPQHRRPRLLPRTAHGPRPRSRRSARRGRPQALGGVARSGRSSAPSSRSRRRPRRIASSSPGNRQERSFSFHDGARYRIGRRHRERDREEAHGRGLRGEGARSRRTASTSRTRTPGSTSAPSTSRASTQA